MKKLISLSAILFLSIVVSCNKSDVAPSEAVELKMENVKHISAIVFTNASYYQHTSYYQENRILEFGLYYKADSNADKIIEALEHLKNVLLTGDTTEAYEYPYAYVTPNGGGFLDCYPEPELQASPKFENFRTWYKDLVTTWMIQNNCTQVVVGENKPKYFVKVHCTVQ